jgi:hypothetical protein
MRPQIAAALRSLDGPDWTKEIAPMTSTNGHHPRNTFGRKRKHDHDTIRLLARDHPKASPPRLGELYKEKTGIPVSAQTVRNVLASNKPLALPTKATIPNQTDPRFSPEVDAIRQIHEIMVRLDPETRGHVARWVTGRFMTREG